MLALVPWIIALWLRQARHNREQRDHLGGLVRGRTMTRRMTGHGYAHTHAYVEQSTGDPVLDDRVSKLKCEAVQEWKRDLVRRPVYRA